MSDANRCPPCRGFTPELAKYYTSHKDKFNFETVFISSDREESAFDEYFGEMPWLVCIPLDIVCFVLYFLLLLLFGVEFGMDSPHLGYCIINDTLFTTGASFWRSRAESTTIKEI